MPTPTGVIAEPINVLRRAVAGSSTFQTKINAANLTESLSKVALQHWSVDALPAADHHLTRPFAIVDYPQLRLRNNGNQCLYVTDSQLSVYYTMDQPVATTHEDGYIEFTNFVGQSLWEATDQGGFENLLPVQEVATIIAPRRIARSERTPDHDFWEAAYSITLET